MKGPARLLNIKIVVHLCIGEVAAFERYIVPSVLKGIGNTGILCDLTGNLPFIVRIAKGWEPQVKGFYKMTTPIHRQAVARICQVSKVKRP